jgi:hydrogenase expression/formation protein HypD
MKYVDEYRDPHLAHELLECIRRRATRTWVLMEVCGGQTHSLLRHGIDAALDGVVELIHGPGCPVCVTSVEAIDLAQNLAQKEGVLLASFGDMLRVPGSRSSLLDVRARGGHVRAVYSPLDAVELARRDPDTQVVFFAVGFETTTPATALAVLQADRIGLKNFSLLVAHVRVQPAMETIMLSDDCRVQGFLAAGHVCTVLGYESYVEFVRRHCVPVAVTGFEPVDLLAGILECVEQLETGRFAVVNRYTRSVRERGNPSAQEIVSQVFEPADRPWRGLGIVAAGGLRLRDEWSRYDAERRFVQIATLSQMNNSQLNNTECRSGDVLAGRIRPVECPSFGTRCTPDSPLGAPMVSSEGACAAYFRYRRVGTAQPVDAPPAGASPR